MNHDKLPVKVLLVGYNGANNTGSEARLLSIIADVRSVLGPEAVITVPTLNEKNLRRYIREDERLRIAPIPAIYFSALRRLIKENDLIMLIEGSCYMDTWAKALLWAYLSTSKYAHQYKKPCLAYAIDAGSLSSSSIGKVRRDASKADLIITRTQLAADRLKDWGVSAPITVTEDTAFTFDAGEEVGTLERLWPGAEKVAGMAVVDFHLWPVVIRPFGSSQDCYRWPYYFSRSPERRRKSERLASGMAEEGDRLVEGIMAEAGVKEPYVRGMLNGGHLGGTVPLRRGEAESMHPSSLPEGLYVADLSLIPESQGMPTMLTAAALAMRVAKRIKETR